MNGKGRGLLTEDHAIAPGDHALAPGHAPFAPGARERVVAQQGTAVTAAASRGAALLDSAAVGEGDRPNVLLVVLDTARADHFGPFGGLACTPAFDELASRGTSTVAVSTSPWTVPSHASMFTALLPFDHGVTGAAAITADRRLASLRPAIARHRDRWLPEVIRRGGYRTVAVSANVWITPEMGFDLGFEEFHSVGMARVTPRGAEADHHWRVRDLAPEPVRRRAKRAVRYVRDARRGRDFGAREALGRVRALAGEPGGRPWFCFVNVMEAHAPYLPPPGFGNLTGRDRLRGPAVNHRYLGDAFVAAHNVGATPAVPEDDLRLLGALYAAEVEYADRFLAGALAALEPLLGRTLVVVTADHGENLGEDHRIGHAAALDERLVRVPLAASGPGAPPLEQAVTSLVSLPGTIAAAAGIADHPYAASGREGVAVAQYESAWNHLRRAADVAASYRLSDRQEAALRTPAALATDGRTWLLRAGDEERTWDSHGPAASPREPVSAAPAVDRLRDALDSTGGEPATPAEGATPEEEAEIESRLQELGYL
jgi:arylsulfatase A-like enzyme